MTDLVMLALLAAAFAGAALYVGVCSGVTERSRVSSDKIL